MWFDASDPINAVDTAGVCSSIKCKSSGTIWYPDSQQTSPIIDTTNTGLKKRCLDFTYDSGAINKSLKGSPIPLQTSAGSAMTIFMITRFEPSNTYSSFCLQQADSSNVVSVGTGSPIIFRFRSNSYYGEQLTGDSGAYTYCAAGSLVGVTVFIIPDMVPQNTTVRSGGFDTSEIYGTGNYFTGAWAPTVLGSTDTLYKSPGLFGELVVYDRVLSASEIQVVEQYLTTKWIQ